MSWGEAAGEEGRRASQRRRRSRTRAQIRRVLILVLKALPVSSSAKQLCEITCYRSDKMR